MVAVGAAATAPRETSWPYSILARRCPPKVRLFQTPRWHARHHVVPSKSNVHLPRSSRGYFDTIPSIGKGKGGEFDNLLALQPHVSDLEEHGERLTRRFQGFPFFRPSTADVRVRAREKRATAVQTPAAPPEPEPPLPCSALLSAAKGRARKATVTGERMSAPLQHNGYGVGMAHLQGQKPVDDFMKWLTSHHIDLVSLWKRLDKGGNWQLTKMEFLTGLKHLRNQKDGADLKNVDLQKLWACLDCDGQGTVTFFEFAPQHAMDLARLKQWALEEFGSMQALFKVMDADGNGKVSFKEFHEACVNLGLPKRLHASTGILFSMLEDPDDESSKGLLTEAQLGVLDSWKSPTYLREKPNNPAAKAFRNALISKHCGNALTAWRRSLDRDNSMRVAYDEFVIACKLLAKQGLREADPDCGIAPLYCAIDRNRSGWFTLKDWHPEAHRCLCAFVAGAKAKHGKVTNFIRAYEDKQNCGVTRSQFRSAWKAEFELPGADGDFVFCGLAGADGMKSLFPVDVLFLQKWEPETELEEEQKWTAIAHEHRPSLFSVSASLQSGWSSQ